MGHSMHRGAVALAALVTFTAVSAGFDDEFTGATLRIDTTHFGVAGKEHVALDRLRIEGAWPGSRVALLDDSGAGAYRVEVESLSDQRVLFSHGYSSLYGEWETTSEASAGIPRAFRESVRVPEPRGAVQVRIRKRGSDGAFRELWSAVVDPESRFVDRADVPKRDVIDLAVHGDPATHVDLLILGDGYAERDTFVADAKRATRYLFDVEPYRSHAERFNVRASYSASEKPGITQPRAGRFRETPLGVRYNTFDSERYVMTAEEHRWRDVAAAAPYDAVLILFPDRQYGGGGIYGLYSTASMGSAFADYLVVHEFGHHFAGLGDEYYTSDVAYDVGAPTVEPWEPNVTALLDPSRLDWADLVDDATPVPTPWSNDEYETASKEVQQRRRDLRAAGASEEELEALFHEERDRLERFFADERYAGMVGAFEGAGYRATGLYRPEVDCMMFTRDRVGFCRVCRRAIQRTIERITR